MPLYRLKLEMFFSSSELTLQEMKLKTLGAKCSTGGTREVPGPERPSAHSFSREDAALRTGVAVDTGLRAAQLSAVPLANSRAPVHWLDLQDSES